MSTHRAVALAFVSVVTWAAETAAEAPEHHAHRNDPVEHTAHSHSPDHAPIGVMGEHMHTAGGGMVSYRYARMRMEGNRDGTDVLSAENVLARGYMATPLDMDMEAHMFSAMYAPADWLTVTAMIPFVRLRMEHRNAIRHFTTSSDGVGDLRVGGLFRIWEEEMHHVHFSLGVSFPTGRIRHKDDVPQMDGSVAESTLPFPMQIGSGTFDLVPGATYTGHARWLSWGGQVRGTIRLGENEAGWTAGDRVDLTSWIAFPWTSWLSTSARIAYHWWGNYDGDEDRPPPPSGIPTADPSLRAGHRIDLLGGFNLDLPLGPLGRNRLGFEMGAPVYQYLDGPQLEADWRLVVGWQKAF